MEIAVFDLDRTITKRATTITLLWGMLIRGKLPILMLLRYAHKYFWNLFLAKEMHREDLDRFTENALSILSGKSPEEFEKDVRLIIEPKFNKLVYKKILTVIAKEKVLGRKLVLATSAPRELAIIFKERLGFDFLLSTEMSVVDGKYDGKLVEGFCHGEGKERQVRALIKAENFSKAHIFSDSSNDLPLFKIFNLGTGVNPDRVLKKWCKENQLEHLYCSKFRFVKRAYTTVFILLAGLIFVNY